MAEMYSERAHQLRWIWRGTLCRTGFTGGTPNRGGFRWRTLADTDSEKHTGRCGFRIGTPGVYLYILFKMVNL